MCTTSVTTSCPHMLLQYHWLYSLSCAFIPMTYSFHVILLETARLSSWGLLYRHLFPLQCTRVCHTTVWPTEYAVKSLSLLINCGTNIHISMKSSPQSRTWIYLSIPKVLGGPFVIPVSHYSSSFPPIRRSLICFLLLCIVLHFLELCVNGVTKNVFITKSLPWPTHKTTLTPSITTIKARVSHSSLYSQAIFGAGGEPTLSVPHHWKPND